MKILEIVYTTPCRSGRVVLAEDGNYYPERVEAIAITPHAPVTITWKCDFLGRKQFSTICKYRHYKKPTTAINFVNAWIQE